MTTEITPACIIAEVMERAPDTLRVFLMRHMACPGCAMAPFETLAEAARTYGLNLDELLDDLRRAASQRPLSSAPEQDA